MPRPGQILEADPFSAALARNEQVLAASGIAPPSGPTPTMAGPGPIATMPPGAGLPAHLTGGGAAGPSSTLSPEQAAELGLITPDPLVLADKPAFLKSDGDTKDKAAQGKKKVCPGCGMKNKADAQKCTRCKKTLVGNKAQDLGVRQAVIYNTQGLHLAQAADDDGLVWKVACKTGTLALSPGPGQTDLERPLELTGDLFDDMLLSYQEQAFPYVTVPETHANGALENTGYVRKAEVLTRDELLADQRFGGMRPEVRGIVEADPEDTRYLLAGIDFTEPEVKEKAERGSIPDTSIGVKFNYRNKRSGKLYKAAWEHLALTPMPWVDGLVPFGLSQQGKPFDAEAADLPYDGVYTPLDLAVRVSVTGGFDPATARAGVQALDVGDTWQWEYDVTVQRIASAESDDGDPTEASEPHYLLTGGYIEEIGSQQPPVLFDDVDKLIGVVQQRVADCIAKREAQRQRDRAITGAVYGQNPETGEDLDLSIHFEPNLHPRDPHGQFMEVLNKLSADEQAHLPGGTTVTRSGKLFVVQGPKGSKIHEQVPSAAEAAHDALNADPKSPDVNSRDYTPVDAPSDPLIGKDVTITAGSAELPGKIDRVRDVPTHPYVVKGKNGYEYYFTHDEAKAGKSLPEPTPAPHPNNVLPERPYEEYKMGAKVEDSTVSGFHLGPGELDRGALDEYVAELTPGQRMLLYHDFAKNGHVDALAHIADQGDRDAEATLRLLSTHPEDFKPKPKSPDMLDKIMSLRKDAGKDKYLTEGHLQLVKQAKDHPQAGQTVNGVTIIGKAPYGDGVVVHDPTGEVSLRSSGSLKPIEDHANDVFGRIQVESADMNHVDFSLPGGDDEEHDYSIVRAKNADGVVTSEQPNNFVLTEYPLDAYNDNTDDYDSEQLTHYPLHTPDIHNAITIAHDILKDRVGSTGSTGGLQEADIKGFFANSYARHWLGSNMGTEMMGEIEKKLEAGNAASTLTNEEKKQLHRVAYELSDHSGAQGVPGGKYSHDAATVQQAKELAKRLALTLVDPATYTDDVRKRLQASQNGATGESVDLSSSGTSGVLPIMKTAEELLASQQAELEALQQRNEQLEAQLNANASQRDADRQIVLSQGRTLHRSSVQEKVRGLQEQGVPPALCLAAQEIYLADESSITGEDTGLQLSVQASGDSDETKELTSPTAIVDHLLASVPTGEDAAGIAHTLTGLGELHASAHTTVNDEEAARKAVEANERQRHPERFDEDGKRK